MTVTTFKVVQCFTKIAPYFKICIKQVFGNELAWADEGNEKTICCKQSQLDDCWQLMARWQCATDVLLSAKNFTDLAAVQRFCRSYVHNDTRCQNTISPAALILRLFLTLFVGVLLIGFAHRLYVHYRRSYRQANVTSRCVPICRHSFNLPTYKVFSENLFAGFQLSSTPISGIPTTCRSIVIPPLDMKCQKCRSDFSKKVCSKLHSVLATRNGPKNPSDTSSEFDLKVNEIRYEVSEAWVKAKNLKAASGLDSVPNLFFSPQQESNSGSLSDVMVNDCVNNVSASKSPASDAIS